MSIIQLGGSMRRVILTGGIGNQLFKSLGALNATGLELDSVKFDITWYQNRTFSNGITADRKFELDKFPAFSNIPLINLNPRISGFESRMISSKPMFMQNIGYLLSSKVDNHKDPNIRVIKSDFEDIDALPEDDKIIELLKFNDSSSEWLKSLKKLALEENPIAIHIRRSDYLTFSQIYPTLGLEYYSSALEHMRNRFGNLPLWLFSDDIDTVVNEFRKAMSFSRVIAPPLGVSSVELLELLTQTKAVITANSTFSWWGAYLGKLAGRVEDVTIPSKFTSLESDPGLKLRSPGWKVIPIN